MAKTGINWNLYPEDVISNPGKPYVYFLSLSNEILNKVAEYFNQDINEFTDIETGLSSVNQAFSFLQTVITNERAKENAFLEYLKTKTENLKLIIPSLEENWADFVKEIQQNLDFGNLGLKDLQNELKRLQQNKTNLEEQRTNYFGNIEIEKDALSKTQEHLEKLIENITNRESTYNTILYTILERYGPSLLQYDGDKLIFDDTELFAMILAISTEISKSFTSSHFMEKGVPLNKNTLEKVLNETNIDKDIELLISNAQKMPWIRENLINSFNLGKYATHRPIDTNLFIKGDQLIKNTKALSEQVHQIFANFKFPKEAIQIIHKNDSMAEIESLIKFTVKGAIMGENTGSKGGKADNIIGFITIDPNRLNPLEQNSELLQKLKEANNLTRELIQTTNKTNTADYYKEQAKHWKDTVTKIDTILTKIQEEYGILSSCFLTEDSTKNYLSLYTTASHTSLHGGSLGANLVDQLNKIETLTIHGGITMVDKEWLTAAIINAGPNMIAHEQKNKLENYLAMFAAILLFDSQVNIADEALQMDLSNINTNTHIIHLFSVNNGYYPLSYVLKLTYDSLTSNLERIKNETISHGVEVNFSGFVKQPSPNYKGNNKAQWDMFANQALNSTKIKMKFLVQFMNVLQNLLPD